MLKLISILMLTTFNISYASFSLESFCSEKILKDLPVLQNGRVKPFSVMAKENISFLSGKLMRNKVPSYSHYLCQLTFKNFSKSPIPPLMIPIDHTETRALLNVEDVKMISIEEIILREDDIKMEYMSQKKLSSYKKDLGKLLQKVEVYNNIISSQTWSTFDSSKLPVQEKNLGDAFVPLLTLLPEISMPPEQDKIISYLIENKKLFDQQNLSPYKIEILYNNLHLFDFALLLALISSLFFLFNKNKKVHLSLASGLLLLQITAITLRVMISGRAPITNMYETVAFSGLGALFICFLVYLKNNQVNYLLGGAVYNFLCLMMIRFANNMLDPTIQPLVPVLRDNFWLSTHVTTIILSYAALAISWVLANIFLLKSIFVKGFNKDNLKPFASQSYVFAKIGITLLAAGIILGGVWADYSWGRFWGWDPKETWSLIALLFYMMILHARYTNWINQERFLISLSIAFLSIMFAWFGVNYILASGLHSYGFSEGGFYFLISFFALQFSIVIIYQIKKWQTGRQAQA
ncbi:cytochrome c biogenesis protein CcsA [Bacteriovoracaceae bacterium]|nr:cytochrome c biogenesis protein CcsA [Bacteriovoracaceae bacterium]